MTQWLVATLCMAVAACAPTGRSTAAGPSPLVGERIDTVCFASGPTGFSQVGDDLLLLKQSTTDYYVVRLGYCPNLSSVEGLKFDDPGQCLKRGSRLLVYDTQFPMKKSASDKPDQCLVLDMARQPYRP